MVSAEHAQTDRLRDSVPSIVDHWQQLASQFRYNFNHSEDPLVKFLKDKMRPQNTLLDIGAGAGRLTLPLAMSCRKVVAVEPSPSMASALMDDIGLYGLSNVNVIQETWEDATVDPEDIVLCAHVIYGISDVEAFLRKLEAHARDQVWIVLFPESPQRSIYPMWQRVHGEERLRLPALPELQAALEEMKIESSLVRLPQQLPVGSLGGFTDLKEAHARIRDRLFLVDGSPKDQLLSRVIEGELEESDGVLRLKGFTPLEPVLVAWKAPKRERKCS